MFFTVQYSTSKQVFYAVGVWHLFVPIDVVCSTNDVKYYASDKRTNICIEDDVLLTKESN